MQRSRPIIGMYYLHGGIKAMIKDIEPYLTLAEFALVSGIPIAELMRRIEENELPIVATDDGIGIPITHIYN